MIDALKIPLFNDPILRRLMTMALKHRLLLVLAGVAMAVTAGSNVALPHLVKILLDEGFVARDPRATQLLPLGLIGVAVVQGLATFTSAYALQRVSQAVLFDLRSQMFGKLLRWPASSFENTSSGVVITKFINQAGTAMASAAEVFTIALRESLVVIGLLAYLFYQNPKLTLVALALIPLTAGVISLFSRRLRRLNRETQALLGDMTRAVQEAIDGQKVIKVYDGYAYEGERFRHVNARLKGFMMRVQIAWSAGTPITQMLAATALAAVVYMALGSGGVQGSGMTPGEFVAFIGAMLMLVAPLKHLANLNGPLQRLLAAGESVFEVVDSSPENDQGSRQLDRAHGAVVFDKVTFQYPTAARAALVDFTLDVKPGEMIALVGPSGAGKTTLISLLPRFIEPQAGEIRIDGVPLRDLTLASLREQLAVVSQEVVLFDDTIRANIAYGASRGATEAQIRAAAEAAYLLPFIESLPKGFDTLIGENAVRLSGGQRQRLSIARAILKNAPILLLDEATSALDSESERFIQASLERLMASRTTFVVAHRLSTIERADRIVVMEQGRIVEVGPHRELIARGGLYAHLHSIQFAQAEVNS